MVIWLPSTVHVVYGWPQRHPMEFLQVQIKKVFVDYSKSLDCLFSSTSPIFKSNFCKLPLEKKSVEKVNHFIVWKNSKCWIGNICLSMANWHRNPRNKKLLRYICRHGNPNTDSRSSLRVWIRIPMSVPSSFYQDLH